MIRLTLMALFLAWAGPTEAKDDETPGVANDDSGGGTSATELKGAIGNTFGSPPPPPPPGNAGSEPKGYTAGAATGGAFRAAPTTIPTHTGTPDSDAGGVFRGTREVGSTVFEETPASNEPMDISSARMNFATVIENYLAARSPKGHWDYKDPETGAPFKLKLQAVNKGSIEPMEGTLYKGQVLLRELPGGKIKPMDFTVDFSAQLWAVKKVAASKDEDNEFGDEEAAPAPVLVNRDAFAEAVRRHLKTATGKTEGVLVVADKTRKTSWRLKLVKIRPAPLRKNPDGTVSGCVEFKEAQGQGRLDLDFIARGDSSGWNVRDVVIHRKLKSSRPPGKVKPPKLDAQPPT